MTAKELREKETPALQEELDGLRKRLFELRTQAVTEKVEDTSQFRKSRRDLARILTVLRQRELESAAGNAAAPK
jgi:large subunit ribosomal protein L29